MPLAARIASTLRAPTTVSWAAFEPPPPGAAAASPLGKASKRLRDTVSHARSGTTAASSTRGGDPAAVRGVDAAFELAPGGYDRHVIFQRVRAAAFAAGDELVSGGLKAPSQAEIDACRVLKHARGARRG